MHVVQLLDSFEQKIITGASLSAWRWSAQISRHDACLKLKATQRDQEKRWLNKCYQDLSLSTCRVLFTAITFQTTFLSAKMIVSRVLACYTLGRIFERSDDQYITDLITITVRLPHLYVSYLRTPLRTHYVYRAHCRPLIVDTASSFFEYTLFVA